MRTAAIAGAALVMTSLLPLLLIGALLGSIGPATASNGVASSAAIGDLPAPTPYSGRDGGCTAMDPTGGRCLSATARRGYDEIVRTFGAPGPDSPIRSDGCWDAHAWNPDSDHPEGRALRLLPRRGGCLSGRRRAGQR